LLVVPAFLRVELKLHGIISIPNGVCWQSGIL
jgi:hypothetical protein